MKRKVNFEAILIFFSGRKTSLAFFCFSPSSEFQLNSKRSKVFEVESLRDKKLVGPGNPRSSNFELNQLSLGKGLGFESRSQGRRKMIDMEPY